MPRRCTVCSHPKVAEINSKLIAGSHTYEQLAKEYGLSLHAIGRHRRNCLEEAISEIQGDVQSKLRKDYISTLEACNLVINKLPELLEAGTPSFTQLLEYLKLRAELLGEKAGQPEIQIVWGKGLSEEEYKTLEDEVQKEILNPVDPEKRFGLDEYQDPSISPDSSLQHEKQPESFIKQLGYTDKDENEDKDRKEKEEPKIIIRVSKED